MNFRSQIDRDGFIVVNDVFSKKEVIKIRSIIKTKLEEKGVKRSKYQLGFDLFNAAVEIPELNWVFSHEGILNILKRIISEEIIFTCHCDAFMGIMSPWHKDDGTGLKGENKGYFGEWTYDNEDVKVYKIVLYLQDHVKNSAGLSVIKGSHKRDPHSREGENLTLKTKAGDIIIFDVRLTHSGQKEIIPLIWTSRNQWIKKILKLISRIPKINTLFYLIIGYLQQKLFGKKVALLWTYGAKNEWTTKFSKANMERQIKFYSDRNLITSTKLPRETKQMLEKKEIIIFDKF